MSFLVTLKCGGCSSETEPFRLSRDWRHIAGNLYGRPPLDEALDQAVPEGWVAFDPYTSETYCPPCWSSIIDPEGDDRE